MRRISIVSAAALLIAVTAANAQSGSISTEEMERIATQDSDLSQQELRALAQERFTREDADQVATQSVERRAPTTSGRVDRDAALRTWPRAYIE